MPFDSFWWQGLDGTRVLTHFSTTPSPPWEGNPDLRNTPTYNAELNAFAALGTWVKLKHKESQRTMLMSYGMGDGGGGPTREMNENAAELREFPGLPRVKQGKVIDFFQRLESESGPALPTWNGELYLEIHRGTYTTQARTKRDNRKAEFLLHDAEFLAAWAARLDPDYTYPHDTFRRAWQTVCLNQFHDIIPGSSIHEVYAESREQYAEVQRLGTAAREEALAVIARQAGGDVVVVNATGFEREDLAFWPGASGEEAKLADVYTQQVEGGTLIGGLTVPPYGTVVLTRGRPLALDPKEYPLIAEPTRLENALLRVDFNAVGDVVRIYHKYADREVLAPGAIGNQWQAFEDRPIYWDAWDVDIFYEEKMYLPEPATSVQVVDSGPLAATVEVRRRILHSEYVQRISLTYNSAVIDFDTWIDWRERHILLKAAFPVDVLSPVATHEIQWGSIQRPTHRNTSWDWARFETAAQKWVDLSEGDFGVALLNDCKYGHDIHDNVIRISLLRSPTEPDPEADQGEHRFTYSLFVHRAARPVYIARHAYQLNDPLIVRPGSGGGRGQVDPFIQPAPGVIIETIKAAEDCRGTIVRLYEPNRTRHHTTLQCGFDVREAWITNLLEDDQEQISVNGREIELYLRPFQIVTLRLI
jgi:alpha-mannosidase